MPSPGGQISGIRSYKNCCGLWEWTDVASHRSPRGLPRASPGAEPDDAHSSSVEGGPRAAAWSGCARSTGCHASPSMQDRLLGPSPGRRTSRSSEKPGEVTRAFLLVNSHGITPFAQVGVCGADELAYKPESVRGASASRPANVDRLCCTCAVKGGYSSTATGSVPLSRPQRASALRAWVEQPPALGN